MDFHYISLAEQIYRAGSGDKPTILARIEKGNPFSQEFMDVYQDFSPLVWALHKDDKELAIALIKKLPQSELLNSFILKTNTRNCKAVQELASFFFLKLLEFDIDIFPPHERALIEDLRNRQLLALLTDSEGESCFFGIPWRLEGHHDYEGISKALFRMLLKNQDDLLFEVEKKARSFHLSKGKSPFLVQAIKSSIDLMQRLPTLSLETDSPQTIFPILMEPDRENQEKILGFVLLNSRWLLAVDLNRTNNPGILIYAISQQFDKALFNHLLTREKTTLQGISRVLNFEAVIDYATEVDSIALPSAKEKNLFIATCEGLFLATLYCSLVNIGLNSLAKSLAMNCTPVLFQANTQAIIAAVKSALPKNDLFLEQLGQRLPAKRLFEKLNVDNKPKTRSHPILKLINNESVINLFERLVAKKRLNTQLACSTLQGSQHEKIIKSPKISPTTLPYSNPLSKDMNLLMYRVRKCNMPERICRMLRKDWGKNSAIYELLEHWD